jgi:hypothetical protein
MGLSLCPDRSSIQGVPLNIQIILEPEREEVAGGWRRLHNEEHHNLYSSQNIIRVDKSRRIRWEDM